MGMKFICFISSFIFIMNRWNTAAEMQRETPKPSSINSNLITTVAMTTAIKTSTADKGKYRKKRNIELKESYAVTVLNMQSGLTILQLMTLVMENILRSFSSFLNS